MVERKKLRLAYYRNLETGLVRPFLSPPKRGKWKRTFLRFSTLLGRNAICERGPALESDSEGT